MNIINIKALQSLITEAALVGPP